MITLETVRGFIRTLISDRGVKMLDDAEWREFTDFGKAIVKITNEGMEHISRNGGNVDLKELHVLHGEFNVATSAFVEKLSFGVDQNGNKVTFAKLFGDAISAHPAAMPSLCMKFLCAWAIEHKINMKFREKQDGYKPKYSSTDITNYTDLPKN